MKAGLMWDVTWKYAGTTKLQCIFCRKVYTTVIDRFNHHFAQTIQNVEPCKVAPKYVKKESLGVVTGFKKHQGW